MLPCNLTSLKVSQPVPRTTISHPTCNLMQCNGGSARTNILQRKFLWIQPHILHLDARHVLHTKMKKECFTNLQKAMDLKAYRS
ncbi:Hypothetical predicted protein [Podarcis lilfordi]|uniref:Uncharacterized protein n=1 Tax=Podarcis lilfordi TaxID=74358 RepID=A0AA35L3F1_9SAUR|nr:Hypothetical predicted protein [Podarcis lilfordi]